MESILSSLVWQDPSPLQILTSGITLLIVAEASLLLRATGLQSHEALRLAWDNFLASGKQSEVADKINKVGMNNPLKPTQRQKEKWVQQMCAVVKDFRA